MRLVFFNGGRGRRLSSYEAARMEASVPADERLPPRAEYELVRTRDFVVYRDNRRDRFRSGLAARRACTLLARATGAAVEWGGKVARTVDGDYVFADRVASREELEHHRTAAPGATVVSLTPSKLAPHVVLDHASVARFYRQYSFPAWFRPFLKMRHFRFQRADGSFAFQSRRYTDSKHGADEKLRHDARTAGRVARCYFSLARVLDSKREREGAGRPIDLLLAALDVDAPKDHEAHFITGKGWCEQCVEGARALVEKARAVAEPSKVVFSGAKGFHLHFLEERSSAELISLIDAMNARERIVDDFTFVRDGRRAFDMHRILKLPGSVDAQTGCVVDENAERIMLRDGIAPSP